MLERSTSFSAIPFAGGTMAQATFPVQSIGYFDSRAHPWARAVRAVLIFGIVLGFISLATDYHTRFYNASIFFAFGQRESQLMFNLCIAVNSLLGFILVSSCIAAMKFRRWALRGLIVWAWLRLLLGAVGIGVAIVTGLRAGGNSTLERFADSMLKLLPQVGAEMRVLILPVVMLILFRTPQVRELFETNQME
jgi:hypothetical protein